MADKPKKKGWIKSATANAHGQFKAKAEKAGESTKAFAEAHKADPGKTGKQARLAIVLLGASHAKDRRKRLYSHPSSQKD